MIHGVHVVGVSSIQEAILYLNEGMTTSSQQNNGTDIQTKIEPSKCEGEKDFKDIENLGIDLLFEYSTTIEYLKSISDDEFENLKDTIIKVELVC